MSVFLIDKNGFFSYNQLLEGLNKSAFYYPLYKTDCLIDYFENLILGLVNSKPLVLLDADLNVSEIDGINESDVNNKQLLSSRTFLNMAELIVALQQSQSEITIFTSGTTGQPKKVIHSVTTLTRNVRIAERYKSQIWAFAYSPTHMAGLQVFFQAFENENTLVNVFNADRNEVYHAIEGNSITHISATPTFYRLLNPVENVYPTVKRVTLGGEKSDEKLYESILKIFPNAKLNNIYASTEAGSLFAAKGENFQIPAAILDKFKVIDGELLIHKSLLGKSENFVYQGDYYCSGDLIEWIDKEQGIFKFKSRKNELINVGGYKVNPGEVENLILQLDEVQQAIVFGKANSVLGNVLCAKVKLQNNKNITELAIRKYLSERLQDFKIPRFIKFVDSFSMTRTGKLKRS